MDVRRGRRVLGNGEAGADDLGGERSISFADLGLKEALVRAVVELGYRRPSPIQLGCIPPLLSGCDVLGVAQTGSGKTAAFALPLLHNVRSGSAAVQMLVLTPTRELALQVGKACGDFVRHVDGLGVALVYGGQPYALQLRALRSKPQVVVGTPGRLLDHLRRGTLDLSELHSLVIDEADEMLRMGFIEDVESILGKIPPDHQTALFSATMPEAIRQISRRFMSDPREVCIQDEAGRRPDIQQSYWVVRGVHKGEALARFLEVESFDAAIVFVRTRSATLEVAGFLERRGYDCAALNGDMSQTLREQTLDRLRRKKLDVLVATDVAARGLDVDRIGLVINYDSPADPESYVHRIGRTGRAGRSGRALLFVEGRERQLLRSIERRLGVSIQPAELPTDELLRTCRLSRLAARVIGLRQHPDLPAYRELFGRLCAMVSSDESTLGTILLRLTSERSPLVADAGGVDLRRPGRRERMRLYRIELGRADGVRTHHIVGVLTRLGCVDVRCIGNIRLFGSHSTVELAESVPVRRVLSLAGRSVLRRPVRIRLVDDVPPDRTQRSGEDRGSD